MTSSALQVLRNLCDWGHPRPTAAVGCLSELEAAGLVRVECGLVVPTQAGREAVKEVA